MSDGECPECGGYRHEGVMIHWDGCSQRKPVAERLWYPIANRAPGPCAFCGQTDHCYSVLFVKVNGQYAKRVCAGCFKRGPEILAGMLGDDGKPLD